MNGGHHDTVQSSKKLGPSGPFKITLFKIVLNLEILKKLRILGLTDRYTYISMYTVHFINHLEVLAPYCQNFQHFFTGGRAQKKLFKIVQNGG